MKNVKSFLKYISTKTVVFTKNTDLIFDRLDKLFEKAEEAFKNLSTDIKTCRTRRIIL